MTLGAWLAARVPPPPPALAARLQVLAAQSDGRDGISAALVVASGEVLQRLLHEGETTRDVALELLAADALATYAFEAEGEAPPDLDARCSWAMRYISSIADPE